MKYLVALTIVAALVVSAASFAAVSCPDRTPAAITAPPEGSVKCQTTMAKAATKFAKAKIKQMGKCMAEQVPGMCPTADVTTKIQAAATKAAEKIAAACADDAAQGGLTSSYADLTDPAPIASCLLSQHNVTADILLGIINGTPGQLTPEADRAKCVKTLNKVGIKYATGVHNAINKCLVNQMKDGVAGDLVPVCVGHYSGGSFVPPTDPTVALKLSTLATNAEADVGEKCAVPGFNYIPSIFACPGAQTTADLQACIICESWNGVLDLLDQENNESGTFVANGAGALQDAVDAASPGDKLLIGSGTYQEEVTIATDNLTLVGCGGATDQRPLISRPAGPGPFDNGIFADSTDGLAFQSLKFFDWDDNGIFVSNADGVTFRDIIADANGNSDYGIFPVTSNNIVVEDCTATGARDTGIYVGQSTNILVRYNHTELNVSGIEIENSANATVHNNYTANNTDGLLVFKLPVLAVQLSNGHEIFDNVSLHNNLANVASPPDIVARVPDGTGMLVLSNDASQFHHNIIQGNNSFGLALVDQKAINALVGGFPPPFPTFSPDQKAENNKVHDNDITGNGLAPDATPPNASPVGGNVLLGIVDSAAAGNCFQNNGSPLTIVLGVLGTNDCP